MKLTNAQKQRLSDAMWAAYFHYDAYTESQPDAMIRAALEVIESLPDPEPAAPPPAPRFTLVPQRRIVSLTYDGHTYWTAVADDGTIWRRLSIGVDPAYPWHRIAVQDLPTPEENPDAR